METSYTIATTIFMYCKMVLGIEYQVSRGLTQNKKYEVRFTRDECADATIVNHDFKTIINELNTLCFSAPLVLQAGNPQDENGVKTSTV